MRKFIIALAATTAIAAAAPAVAQTGSGSFDIRTEQLQTQLQAGIRSGAITRAEAAPLREQLRQLTRLERQYSRGGFNVQERADLRSRTASLRHGIRVASRDGDDRYGRNDRDDDRYGRDCPPGLERKDNGCLPPGQVGRDGRDGRWGEDVRYGRGDMMDRNRDGYDDRDLNRDGRIDDREWRMAEAHYDDRDDDRGERAARRGGIGGVFDDLLGRDNLRVGQRVTAESRLGSVPSAYRGQYRDGNGVYYRSDGRSIYQIEARNDTIVRIYGMNR